MNVNMDYYEFSITSQSTEILQRRPERLETVSLM